MKVFRTQVKDALGRLASVGGTYSRRFGSRVTIVAFHRVNDSLEPDGLTCDSERFEALCKFFHQHFRVVSLSALLASRRANKEVRGTLAITFDDGYRDNFEIAAPILLKLNLPATFFVTTGFIGTQIVPHWDAHLPRQPWMTWDEVRALSSMGFEIGSHTETHIDLGTADLQAIRTDLVISKNRLSDELGKPVDMFAYPFGGPEHIRQQSRELVREAGYICCMSCHGGVNSATVDPFFLKRVPIGDWFRTPHQFGFELSMMAAGSATRD
jgi:peptidoglycan/xylan/chitin deacetylase (PgdA/CDA1 family)